METGKKMREERFGERWGRKDKKGKKVRNGGEG